MSFEAYLNNFKRENQLATALVDLMKLLSQIEEIEDWKDVKQIKHEVISIRKKYL